MNIQEAKYEIARTFRAYSKKDENGNYRIPVEKQRPVLLIGPPGIGKTAIMNQIADETGCGLVSYTMTHHTRQSAIGLPFIAKRVYNGREYSVTEYTMSEIVASIYDYMEATGKRSGILFLDEINCVSETLAPVILQLLQNKTFGVHALPEGWMIAAAGNPPEYNKSVRELDVATLDRVKHMEIAADLPSWQNYARENSVHPAIISYLTVYPEHFYCIESTPRGRLFVTARGWEDLSFALISCEEDGEQLQEEWFLQYLQHDEIAHSFALYYRLFRSLSGREGDLAESLLADRNLLRHFSSAECLTVASLLFHPVESAGNRIRERKLQTARIKELLSLLPEEENVQAFVREKENAVAIKLRHLAIGQEEALRERTVLHRLADAQLDYIQQGAPGSFRSFVSAETESEQEGLRAECAAVSGMIGRSYQVLECCSEAESSLLYFTADISGNAALVDILNEYPVEMYKQYCLKLM